MRILKFVDVRFIDRRNKWQTEALPNYMLGHPKTASGHIELRGAPCSANALVAFDDCENALWHLLKCEIALKATHQI